MFRFEEQLPFDIFFYFRRVQTFEDKVIWITGASSGIGREMAAQASRMGAKLVLSARRVDVLEEIKNELASPDEAMVLQMDMEQSLVFSEKVNQVMERFGRIDLLFNNAGISQRSEIHETSIEIDRRIMEVNYFGTAALTKAVLPILRKQKSGYVAVVSSVAGKTGFYQRSAYSASKHALHGFFETLKLEEANNNIKVTLLCPGGVQTDISKNALESDGKPYGETDKMQAEGMPVGECVKQMIEAIRKEKPEVIISQGSENFGMKLKAVFPKLYFNILRKRQEKQG